MNHNTDASEALTLRNERRDFPEWHLGRPAYVLWALEFDTAAVLPRMQQAQAQLADLLLDGYCRQPHVTLGLCGFPSAAPAHGDDFGADLIHTHVQALQRAQPAAFEIEIGGLDSFSSVPYFTVHAPAGQLAALRACVADPHRHGAADGYVPHVTVGLYADAWPLAAVRSRLAHCEVGAVLRVTVSGISLLSYAASEIGGPLQRVASYAFATGTLRWHGAPLFS